MTIKPSKGLGRGLSALLGDAALPETVSAPGVQSLAVDMLEPSPFQPRREMDETALTELADSIAQRGILQPLLVRPHPAKSGQYQIIAGERRWRAAQKAQLHEVPVLVRELSDSDAMAAGLVENLQREDLNVVEEAMGYQRLLTEFKMTQEALGDAIGKSRAHIGNTLRLLKLPPLALSMLRSGAISPGHARALLTHPDPYMGVKIINRKGLSVRQTEEWVAAIAQKKVDKAMKQAVEDRGEPDDAVVLANSLTEKLGMRVKITYNGTGGTVSLSYGSLDQLDTIIALLNA